MLFWWIVNFIIIHIQISFLWAFDPVPQVEARLHELFPDYDFTNQTVSGTINIFQFSALYTILHMTVPISPVYVIIFILRKKIIKKLCDNSESMTKETRQLHSQLLMASFHANEKQKYPYCNAWVNFLPSSFETQFPLFEIQNVISTRAAYDYDKKLSIYDFVENSSIIILWWSFEKLPPRHQ